MRKKLIPWLVLSLLVFAAAGIRPAAAQDGAVGYVRVIQMIYPSADVLVDGQPVLTDLAYTMTSSDLNVSAGDHVISVVPTGADASAGASADITITAWNSYVVATIGEFEGASPYLLTIDETAEIEQIGRNSAGSVVLMIHNVSNAPDVDVFFNDELVVSGMVMGDYVYTVADPGMTLARVTPTEHADLTLFEIPYVISYDSVSQIALSGETAEILNPEKPYPFERHVLRLSKLVLVGFLSGYTMVPDNELATFALAVQKAGISETFTSSDVVTIFAPKNEAWDALPEDTREELFNDPKALADLLNYHIVREYLPSYQLIGEHTLTTIDGAPLRVTMNPGESLVLNDIAIVGSENRAVAGVMYLIDTVLFPPAE